MARQTKVDSLIEAAYHRHAQGRTIDVFKICDLYAYCRDRLAGGASVDVVMPEAVDKFCNPVGEDAICSLTVEFAQTVARGVR